MSEEEKKAIEELKGIDIRCFFSVSMEVSDFMIDKAEEINEYIKTILTLIEKRQKEIELKDKVIDEMSTFIEKEDLDAKICEYVEDKKCKGHLIALIGTCNDCIKQYFINKVKENKE